MLILGLIINTLLKSSFVTQKDFIMNAKIYIFLNCVIF